MAKLTNLLDGADRFFMFKEMAELATAFLGQKPDGDAPKKAFFAYKLGNLTVDDEIAVGKIQRRQKEIDGEDDYLLNMKFFLWLQTHPNPDKKWAKVEGAIARNALFGYFMKAENESPEKTEFGKRTAKFKVTIDGVEFDISDVTNLYTDGSSNGLSLMREFIYWIDSFGNKPARDFLRAKGEIEVTPQKIRKVIFEEDAIREQAFRDTVNLMNTARGIKIWRAGDKDFAKWIADSFGWSKSQAVAFLKWAEPQLKTAETALLNERIRRETRRNNNPPKKRPWWRNLISPRFY